MLTEERKAATRLALRKIAELRMAKKCPPAFVPGTPLVIAIEDELVETVMSRITSYQPPVVLAVYFPSSGRLEILTVEPGKRPGERAEDDDEPLRVARKTTIGMVVDSGERISLPQQWNETYETHKLTLASV